MSQANFASFAAAFIGRTVMRADKVTGAETALKVEMLLSNKLGSMKNGDKAEYVLLKSVTDDQVTYSIHPTHADRLFKKGEDSGLKLVPLVEEVKAEPVVETVAETTPEVKADGVVETPVVETKADAAPAEPSAPSKKDLSIAIFKRMAGSERKDIIATMMSEAGISKPGASTYYQNIKQGKWV